MYCLYITSRTEDVSYVLRDELAVAASIKANPREQLQLMNTLNDFDNHNNHEYILRTSAMHHLSVLLDMLFTEACYP